MGKVTQRTVTRKQNKHERAKKRAKITEIQSKMIRESNPVKRAKLDADKAQLEYELQKLKVR